MNNSKKLISVMLIAAGIFSGCERINEEIPENSVVTNTSIESTVSYSVTTNDTSIQETTTESTSSEETSNMITETTEDTSVSAEPETEPTTKSETTSETELSDIETEATTTESSIVENTSIAEPRIIDPVPHFDGDYNTYFANDLFIGDSICSGLKAYGVLDIKNCAAKGNVASWNLFDYTYQYEYSTNELPLIDIINMYQPQRIFVWCGMNDINMVSSEDRISNIQAACDVYRELIPDVDIYILSITPIMSTHKWNTGTGGNIRINSYNADMKEYCDSIDNLTYIEVGTAIMGADGYMDEAYSGGDGLHINKKAYYNVLDAVISNLS